MVRAEWLLLRPRDTILVRDGRQFDAGADATAEPVLPRPSTTAGAAFAAYGTPEQELASIGAPMLARRVVDTWTGVFPAPADLVHPAGDTQAIRRLRPQPLPVVTDLPDCPQWLVGDGDAAEMWLSAEEIASYLRGELIRPGGQIAATSCGVQFRNGADRREPLARERRIGLARTDDRVAREGLLYQATHLRPAEDTGFLVKCVLPDGWDRTARGPVPLGGRGRVADVDVVTDVDWPAGPDEFPGGRVLVYVASPAVWPTGWRIPPPGKQDVRLVAAAVGRTEPIATASPRNGMAESRALRWAVPAGSVYLLEFGGPDGPETAAAWASEVHGMAYGPAVDDRLRTAGFGTILTGVW